MNKEQLVIKWLNNELSDEELKAFSSLEDADLYQEIVEEIQRFDGKKHAKVASFDTINAQLETKTNSSFKWVRVVSGIAALFIVGFAMFTFLNKTEMTTFETELAKTQTITLPDNSMVTLNELSELKFSKTDWDTNRSLELEGEAFFDVEKGNRFDVNTSVGQVSVLGTEFNVFSRDSLFRVSCYEGLVRVTYNDKVVELPAGSEFILRSDIGTTSNIVIAEPYWLKNMSTFDNASFKNVISELEKQFNIHVQYPQSVDNKFTGAFEHDNLDNALKSITIPFNLTYEILNSKEVLIKDVQQ